MRWSGRRPLRRRGWRTQRCAAIVGTGCGGAHGWLWWHSRGRSRRALSSHLILLTMPRIRSGSARFPIGRFVMLTPRRPDSGSPVLDPTGRHSASTRAGGSHTVSTRSALPWASTDRSGIPGEEIRTRRTRQLGGNDKVTPVTGPGRCCGSTPALCGKVHSGLGTVHPLSGAHRAIGFIDLDQVGSCYRGPTHKAGRPSHTPTTAATACKRGTSMRSCPTSPQQERRGRRGRRSSTAFAESMSNSSPTRR
jgi:hypothetical protein